MGIQFEGMLFVPPEQKPLLNLQAIQMDPRNEADFYAQFKMNMKAHRSWKVVIDTGGPPLAIGFVLCGQTAGVVAWQNEDQQGNITHVHGFTVLLSGIDQKDDKTAIDMIRNAQPLKDIQPDHFDIPLEPREPVAATFFSHVNSANNPLFQPLTRIVGAGFFDQFGVA